MERRHDMRKVLSKMANLLDYPDEQIHSLTRECRSELSHLDKQAAEHIQQFQEAIKDFPLNGLEEVYTRTFDLQMLCYPYIGYHLFGESYQRGAFLSQLRERFRKYNFSEGKELPDHIGVLLRFLAVVPDDEECRVLVDDGMAPALHQMQKVFEDNKSPYGYLIRALTLLLEQYKPRELTEVNRRDEWVE